MDSATERMARIRQQCEILGLEFERVSGVDVKSLSKQEVASRATPACAKWCTVGALGCAMSHIGIWKRLAAGACGDFERALILEDDARVDTANFWRRLPQILRKEVPQDYDVLLLGCVGLCEPNNDYKSAAQYGQRHGMPLKKLHPRGGKVVGSQVFIPEFFGGTHAYIVSKKGAQRLVEAIPLAEDHVDWSMAEAAAQGRLHIYAVYPDLARQVGMQDSLTASYGFPGLANSFLSTIKDYKGIEYSYYYNVGMYRIGSLQNNIMYCAWHNILFWLGVVVGTHLDPKLVGMLVAADYSLYRWPLADGLSKVTMFAMGVAARWLGTKLVRGIIK